MSTIAIVILLDNHHKPIDLNIDNCFPFPIRVDQTGSFSYRY
jgi:hypothetical protein